MNRFSMWTVRLLLGLAVLAPTSRAAAQAFVVVVNAAGPAALSRDDVSKVFLKKSGQLTAVDQSKDSKVRSAFSAVILGRPVSAIASYWQQQIFSGGDTPPSEKRSDADVLAYVRGNPKAIGYVSAGTDLGDGVRAVTIQ
jgi:ABC-type phosphate transport system substrate-binding protein